MAGDSTSAVLKCCSFFSRPLKGTSTLFFCLPAVKTAGYYHASRWRGTGLPGIRLNKANQACWGPEIPQFFSRPLKGTSTSFFRLPAVKTAGYYHASRWRGTGLPGIRLNKANQACWGFLKYRNFFSRPLKGTSTSFFRLPAVKTAGYYHASRWRGTRVWRSQAAPSLFCVFYSTTTSLICTTLGTSV